MTEFLIILIAVALAIAPLLHFVPSKRQRRITRMREQAAVAGLFVEFRDLPEVGNSAKLTQPTRGTVIYYGVRLPPPRGKDSRRRAWLLRNDHWQCTDRGVELPAELRELADAVLAASLEDSSCGVYWQERGDVEEVQQIIAALGSWKASITT